MARFPGAAGRIPNFTGAEAAAERLRALPARQAASAVKANPGSAHWPVRQRALEHGSCRRDRPRPSAGICGEDLTREKIAAIPLLAAQRPGPS